MTKAVAYIRVSSIGQCAEGKDGFTRQSEAIRKYAEANDIEISATFKDEGISGKTELDNRPALAACLVQIESNGVKLILVESADRLARDSMISELIIREIQKAGGTIIAASGGVDLTAGDETNPTAKLIRQILAAVAEFDRCITVLKLRAARQRTKVVRGKCEGRKAFGEKPHEAPILQQIEHLSDLKYSADHIAAYLTEHKLSTRSGKPWRAAVIKKILARANNATVKSAQKVDSK